MKKILKKIEFINLFAFLFLLLLLLACMFHEGNKVADAIDGAVFVLFMISLFVFVVGVVVFLVWMLVERSYLEGLKKTWKNAVYYAAVLLIYEVYQFVRKGDPVDVLRIVVVTAILLLINPVVDYMLKK